MAIVGAGPVGLGMAKALKADGIPDDQFEADDDIGGNWSHGVYSTIVCATGATWISRSSQGVGTHPRRSGARRLLPMIVPFVDRRLRRTIARQPPAPGTETPGEAFDPDMRAY